MKRVYICSRYRADENHTVSENIRRASSACGHALDRGYAPIAPHLIYPRCLDDNDPKEREIGIRAGQEWLPVCDELWQWGASVSEGMKAEITLAIELGIPVKVFNSIGIPQEYWNHEIKFINYDGKYPNLCSGILTFSIDGEERKTTRSALRSGGGIGSWKDDFAGAYYGDWTLCGEDPAFADFNRRDFEFLTAEINAHVSQGCCGGCR